MKGFGGGAKKRVDIEAGVGWVSAKQREHSHATAGADADNGGIPQQTLPAALWFPCPDLTHPPPPPTHPKSPRTPSASHPHHPPACLHRLSRPCPAPSYPTHLQRPRRAEHQPRQRAFPGLLPQHHVGVHVGVAPGLHALGEQQEGLQWKVGGARARARVCVCGGGLPRSEGEGAWRPGD